jgi:hypothetical protein
VRNVGGLLLAGAAVLFVYLLLPLGTAFEFGGDEGFELMKGFLCSKGYALYKDIWSDQPPAFTMLLSAAFKTWGPSILVARLIAAAFGTVLFAAFYRLVSQRSGLWAGFLGTFFLLASPAVLQLSVSVMKEVPAIGTGLASACLLFEWSRRVQENRSQGENHSEARDSGSPGWGWLVASGLVMGLAVQIKVTVLVLLPVMLVEIALARYRDDTRGKAAADMLKWTAVGLATFVVVGLIWGFEGLWAGWKANFGAHSAAGWGSPHDFPLPGGIFLDHAEVVLAAGLGLVLVVRQRRLREMAFPIVLLVSALAIHIPHRPWWNYYYLHFAVPFAWLAGQGVSEVIKAASILLSGARQGAGLSAAKTKKKSPLSGNSRSSRLRGGAARQGGEEREGSRSFGSAVWKGAAACALAGLALVRSEARLESGVRELRRRPRVSESTLVAKMKEYARRTRWVYARPVIYAFHAGVPVPPELAVVTLKRLWSNQISRTEIIETCARYDVEQILLETAEVTGGWKAALNGGYREACEEGGLALCVANSLEER